MNATCKTCGTREEMIHIGDKMFSANYLAEVLAKHNRLIHKGIKPYLTVAQELNVTDDQLNSYLLTQNELRYEH